MGGAGSAVQEFCALNSINTPGCLIGIPDKFIEHGSREEMIEMAISIISSLDPCSINLSGIPIKQPGVLIELRAQNS